MKTNKKLKRLPKSYIGKELADKRINSYKAHKYDAQCELSKKAEEGDTLSVWYSKEHIEDLLQEIEFADGNGLRISFGMYEEDHKKYPSQTCLLFNVTRINKDNFETKDIVIEDEPDFEKRMHMTNESKKSEEFNLGSLCPPRCSPTGLGGIN